MASTTTTTAETEVSRLSVNSELTHSSVPIRPARPQRRHEPRETLVNQTKFYRPNAVPIFDQLFKLEKGTLTRTDLSFRFIASHLMPCRIYYAFLFHLRLLLARKDARVASTIELEVIDELDKLVHINSLPIHAELIDIFRDTFPSRSASTTECAITPEAQNFPRFEVIQTQNGSFHLKDCCIPASHDVQPSPKLGLHLLKWYRWKLEQPHDDDLPDVSQRLTFLTLGTQPSPDVTSVQREPDHDSALQFLFNNPIFKHALPVQGGMNHGLIKSTSKFDLPPAVPTYQEHVSRKTVLLFEMLTDDDCLWINQTKYIVATMSYHTKGLNLFDEVSFPYGKTELQHALNTIEKLTLGGFDSSYMSYGQWMNVFHTDVEEPIRSD